MVCQGGRWTGVQASQKSRAIRAVSNLYLDCSLYKYRYITLIINTEASYETAYSITKRPTHYNTSWDMAKFKAYCHKFAGLSEHNYGVSILNIIS